MQKVRRLPGEYDAIEVTSTNWREIREFVGEKYYAGHTTTYYKDGDMLEVLIGSHRMTGLSPQTARTGDWVIRDVEGTPYPVNRRVFERTYEVIQ